jgi:acetolactate synthase-1/2/3 large subunit
MEHQVRTYSDQFSDWLLELGYTHCFFVAGGNVMHLLNSARSRFKCIPVVHEVAATIATEYFNQVNSESRAFALVTAGPGITNALTGIAGAWLEHRELLIIGGQVKSKDLKSSDLRQRGIQEIDGVSLAEPVCKRALRIAQTVSKHAVAQIINDGAIGRKGPIFIEFCLDVQGGPPHSLSVTEPLKLNHSVEQNESIASIDEIVRLLGEADRPALLIGAGVERSTCVQLRDQLIKSKIPIFTTWHAADRIDSEYPNYFGRPETWGQRSSNLLINQADVVLVLGARLGYQETGFNWEQYCARAKIIHVEIDIHELEKGHPNVHLKVHADANIVLRSIADKIECLNDDWFGYCELVREAFPLDDPENRTGDGFISPYRFYMAISKVSNCLDIWIPASSGGANSVAIQALSLRPGQISVCNNGLASMGYGLPGAIGAAFAAPDRRVLLVEGDGSITQNIQELATLAVNQLNVKVFIFDNQGYGSIRTTQRNYFHGAYLGCDIATGLGFPDWSILAKAYGIPYFDFRSEGFEDNALDLAMENPGPLICKLTIDPEQTYWPKISSRIGANGVMESDPLYEMTPKLGDVERGKYGKYL